MVVLACRDNHKEVKGFLLRRVSWGFSPYLIHSGGAKCIMATLHILSGGFNAPLRVTLGSPAFSSSSSSSSSSSFSVFCA